MFRPGYLIIKMRSICLMETIDYRSSYFMNMCYEDISRSEKSFE